MSVWTRLGPIVCRLVEGIRNDRLLKERILRIERRHEVIEEEYVDAVLRVVPWPMISFIPGIHRVWEHPGLEDVLALLKQDDTNPSPQFRKLIRSALISSMPKMQHGILRAVDAFRSVMPQSWVTAVSSPLPLLLSHTFADSQHSLDLTSLANLDRAAFVFRCQDVRPTFMPMRPVHFGLDGLSHGCLRRQMSALEVDDDLHGLMVDILALLGLDPATATPLDVDQRAPILICMHDHDAMPGVHASGVAFTSWRDAVRACLGHATCEN